MAYADAVYYFDIFRGSVISIDDLPRALEDASDQVDFMTFNRIRAIGFDNLTPFQQEMVQKAVCQHAEYVFQYGDFLNMPLTGYSAGSISMSFKSEALIEGIQTSGSVQNNLAATGLTNRRLR